MRKGYGPTGASYALPLTRFTEMVKSGTAIAVGISDTGEVLSAPLPKELSAESIKNIFADADCACYHGGKEMIIPSLWA